MSKSANSASPPAPSNLTLRQLRAFLLAAEEKSMTRAADKLHLTPSALSMLIRSLEEEMGMRLFERTTRRIELTDAGVQLLPTALKVLAMVDEAVAEMQRTRLRKTERIAVATSPLLAASLLPEVIARFRESFPNVQIALFDVPVDQVAGMVLKGDAELGICTSDAGASELHSEVLYKDSLMLACPEGHALAARSEIHWAELCDQPLVLLKPGSGTRSLIDQALSRWTSQIQPAFEVANISTAVGLVSAGLGLSVLPAYSLARSGARGICARPLVDPEVTREIVAWSAPARPLSAVASSFLACFREAGIS